MSKLVTKEYLERTYKQAVLEYRCAHNEDEQWQARKEMARLEQIAAQEFSFEYADQLHELVK